MGERLQRELQRQAPGRAPERRDLLHAEGGPGAARRLATTLQPHPSAQLTRLPPAGAGSDPAAHAITLRRGIGYYESVDRNTTLNLVQRMQAGHVGSARSRCPAPELSCGQQIRSKRGLPE